MKKLGLIITVLILVMVYAFPTVSYAELPLPIITINPGVLDLPVDIPDTNLCVELHAKTGVPDSKDICRSDLEALTGTLTITGKGISNAEGIQYCKNISALDLSDNGLSTLPNLSEMTSLKTINLTKNLFTSVPSGVFLIPNLELLILQGNPISSVDPGISAMSKLKQLDLSMCSLTSFPSAILQLNITGLSLHNTPIGELPETISSLNKLKTLSVNNTGLKKLPKSLYTMSTLLVLDISNNGITSLSSDISGMTSLNRLYMHNNKLETLPDAIFTLPAFEHLIVSNNNLHSLPSNIGKGKLKTLSASFNRISSLPKSIGQSSNLYAIDVMLNRLTSLPSNLDDKTYDFINVEFNFIDMSVGSTARNIIENTISSSKYFERQLTPINGIVATPTSNSVTLAWQPCKDGTKDNATWEVESYSVYIIQHGKTVKVADVDKTKKTFTHTGLTPETPLEYRVGVNYHVIEPAFWYDVSTTAFTTITTTTLPADVSSTPDASAYYTAETIIPQNDEKNITAEPSEASISPQPLDTQTSAQPLSPPLWALVLIVVLGIAVITLSAVVVFIIHKKAKTKKNKS